MFWVEILRAGNRVPRRPLVRAGTRRSGRLKSYLTTILHHGPVHRAHNAVLAGAGRMGSAGHALFIKMFIKISVFRKRRALTKLRECVKHRVFKRPQIAGAIVVAMLAVALWPCTVAAHNVSKRDASFVQANRGTAVGAFMYLGAKHMVTGYDHLLFLVGVIFFLYRLKDIVQYVSLFTLGHSTTLLLGVFAGMCGPILI